MSAHSGKTETLVNLADYDLGQLPPEKLEFLSKIVRALEEQGYKVKVNGLDSIHIDFSDPSD